MMIFLLSLIFLQIQSSTNGKLYKCDGQADPTGDNPGTFCVFAVDTAECSTDDTLECLTEPLAGNSWVNIADQELGKAMVANAAGTEINPSPRPWTDGDELVAVTSNTITGDNWAYALAFSMVGPLREKMMVTPWELYADADWDKYTRMFTDCLIKVQNGDGNDLSSASVHAQLNSAMDGGAAHTYLQYLEEAAIDLVCLMTDLNMSGGRRQLSDDRCGVMRDNWGISLGTKCNCWSDAYVGMYGSEPNVEADFFSDCSVVGSTTEPAETTTSADDGNDPNPSTGPTCCDGSTAACADGTTTFPCSDGAPVCADGTNALPPGTDGCDDDTTSTEEPDITEGSDTEPTETSGDDPTEMPDDSCVDDATFATPDGETCEDFTTKFAATGCPERAFEDCCATCTEIAKDPTEKPKVPTEAPGDDDCVDDSEWSNNAGNGCDWVKRRYTNQGRTCNEGSSLAENCCATCAELEAMMSSDTEMPEDPTEMPDDPTEMPVDPSDGPSDSERPDSSEQPEDPTEMPDEQPACVVADVKVSDDEECCEGLEATAGDGIFASMNWCREEDTTPTAAACIEADVKVSDDEECCEGLEATAGDGIFASMNWCREAQSDECEDEQFFHAVDGCLNFRLEGEDCEELLAEPGHEYKCAEGLECRTELDEQGVARQGAGRICQSTTSSSPAEPTEEPGHCVGKLDMWEDRCKFFTNQKECEEEGVNAISNGVCDWTTDAPATPEPSEDVKTTEEPEECGEADPTRRECTDEGVLVWYSGEGVYDTLGGRCIYTRNEEDCGVGDLCDPDDGCTASSTTEGPSCNGNLMEDGSCCSYDNSLWGDFSDESLYPEECCDGPVTLENTCPDVEMACSPNSNNPLGLVCVDGTFGADGDWNACNGFENRAACPIEQTSTPIMCDNGSCESDASACDSQGGVKYGSDACEDPCSCPEGTGWSASDNACKAGSSTECYECPTMSGCEMGSCMEECYEYDPMKTCQCEAGNCVDYNTCCEDQTACGGSTPSSVRFSLTMSGVDESNFDDIVSGTTRAVASTFQVSEDDVALTLMGGMPAPDTGTERPTRGGRRLLQSTMEPEVESDIGVRILTDTEESAEELSDAISNVAVGTFVQSIADELTADGVSGVAVTDVGAPSVFTMTSSTEEPDSTDPPVDPTEEPMTGDCECGVTAQEFERLRITVERLESSLNDVGSLEATVNDVISTQVEIASCMSDAVERLGVNAGTDAPADTEAPSEDDTSEMGTLITDGSDSSIDNRCGLGPQERAFRLDYTSLENCISRCSSDTRCNYATHNNDVDDGIPKFCIGCITMSGFTDGWTAYETVSDNDAAAPMGGGRRQLTQLSVLEEENAALKEMVEQLEDELRRRN